MGTGIWDLGTDFSAVAKWWCDISLEGAPMQFGWEREEVKRCRPMGSIYYFFQLQSIKRHFNTDISHFFKSNLDCVGHHRTLSF